MFVFAAWSSLVSFSCFMFQILFRSAEHSICLYWNREHVIVCVSVCVSVCACMVRAKRLRAKQKHCIIWIHGYSCMYMDICIDIICRPMYT